MNLVDIMRKQINDSDKTENTIINEQLNDTQIPETKEPELSEEELRKQHAAELRKARRERRKAQQLAEQEQRAKETEQINKVSETVSEAVKELKSEQEEIVSATHIENTEETPEISIVESKKDKEYIDQNGLIWTPHKYKIGDVVWVPQDEQIIKSTIFDPIRTEQQKVPKKLTIATVLITNKVSYTFKETSKVIVFEGYVSSNYEDCLKLCEELS